MAELSYALFATPVGRCAIVWGPVGLVAVQLPAANERATRARIAQRFPEAAEVTPTAEVERALAAIAALLDGQGASALGSIVLDMDGVPTFHRRVYEAARAIPPGSTLSYAELAALAGSPRAARAVGQALRNNPFAIVVPCHRVLAAGGKVGGFTASGGIGTKLKLLSLERARLGAAAGGAGAGGAGAGAASGFAFDPAQAVAHLREADAALARVIDAVGPFALRADEASSVFLALAQAIVYQQLHGKAAAAIFARLCALFPRAHEGFSPKQLLRASDEKLRGAGLSRSKLLALRDLADKTQAGELPTLADVASMSDEAIIESLTHVRGIGRWTVEMLLIFRLGRPDVLPVDDFGVRKGFAHAFRKKAMPERAEVLKRGKRWAPYRSVASWYLWRAADLADGKGI